MSTLDRNTPSRHSVRLHMIFTADFDELMTDYEVEWALLHTKPEEVLHDPDKWRLEATSHQLLFRWVPGGEMVKVERPIRTPYEEMQARGEKPE